MGFNFHKHVTIWWLFVNQRHVSDGLFIIPPTNIDSSIVLCVQIGIIKLYDPED